MLAAASTWLRARRSRCVFLLLCSPIIIPFLCATFPLLCAAELCLRLCRRRTKLAQDEAEDERLRRCEEGCGGGCAEEEDESTEEMGLLQRYLEDPLLLVGSVYDCGDDQDLYQQIRDYDPRHDQKSASRIEAIEVDDLLELMPFRSVHRGSRPSESTTSSPSLMRTTTSTSTISGQFPFVRSAQLRSKGD